MVVIPIVFLYLCYLGISIWLCKWGNRKARERGYRFKYPGVLVILLMWGPILWDAPLQEWEYRRLCKNEAGLQVFKTPAQWDAENGGVLSMLEPVKGVKSEYLGPKYTRYILNERFARDSKSIPRSFGLIERRSEIIDVKKNEVMLRYTDFDAGPLHVIPKFGRIWMLKPSCRGTGKQATESPFLGIDSKFRNRRNQ